MINEYIMNSSFDEMGNVKIPKHKVTEVILHCFTLTKNKQQSNWKYAEDANPNPNDGKRHHIRSFVIAHDDNPYPNTTKLKALLTTPTTNHSNIKTSGDYGKKLDGFCPTCLASVKLECRTKFGGIW